MPACCCIEGRDSGRHRTSPGSPREGKRTTRVLAESPSDAWADGGGAELPIRGGALAVASEITGGNEEDDDGGCGREGGGRDRRDG